MPLCIRCNTNSKRTNTGRCKRCSNKDARARRKLAVIQATPTWLSEEHRYQIDATYDLCNEMKQFYPGSDCPVVDHVVPIRGRTVCGLHVPWNLEIITNSDNRKKSNKF